MPDEEHPNQVNLENKLDELSTLPGEAMIDKNQVWEKLYTNLHKKQSRKMQGWYWVAAACILLAIFIFGITGANKDKSLVKNNPENTPTQSPAIQPQPVKKINQMTSDNPVSKNKKIIQTIPEKNIPLSARGGNQTNKQLRVQTNAAALPVQEEKPMPVQPKPQANPVPLLAQSSNQTPIQSMLQANFVLSAKTEATGKAIPSISKKKLRVVHVNELDEPAEEDNQLVRNSVRHAFGIRWIGQTAPLNTSTETLHSDYAILKINLSSPN